MLCSKIYHIVNKSCSIEMGWCFQIRMYFNAVLPASFTVRRLRIDLTSTVQSSYVYYLLLTGPRNSINNRVSPIVSASLNQQSDRKSIPSNGTEICTSLVHSSASTLSARPNWPSTQHIAALGMQEGSFTFFISTRYNLRSSDCRLAVCQFVLFFRCKGIINLTRLKCRFLLDSAHVGRHTQRWKTGDAEGKLSHFPYPSRPGPEFLFLLLFFPTLISILYVNQAWLPHVLLPGCKMARDELPKMFLRLFFLLPTPPNIANSQRSDCDKVLLVIN